MIRMKQHPLSPMIIHILVILTLLNQISCQVLFDTDNNQCPTSMPTFCACNIGRVVCNCNSDDVVILDELFSNRVDIQVNGCKRVSIPRGSFRNSSNLALTFRHIRDIRFVSGSFERDVLTDIRLNITLLNSITREIPGRTFSISGSRNSRQPVPYLALHIVNSMVGKVARGALGNFYLKRLSFENSTFDLVETQALDNSITGEITLLNNIFRHLENNAIILHNTSQTTRFSLEGTVFEGNVPLFLVVSLSGDAHISNNVFPHLETSPWNLRVYGDVTLQHNSFTNIPRNGIHLSATGQIHLRDTDIHLLQAHALQLIVPIGKKAIIFLEYNVIHKHEPMSLCLHPTFEARAVIIKHTLFQQPCLCNITADIAKALGVSNITISLEALYRDGIHEQWFQGGECLLGNQRMTNGITGNSPLLPFRKVSIDQYLVHSCLDSRNLQTVLLLVFAVILVTIAVCVILAWRRIKYRTTVAPSSANSDYHSFTEPVPPPSSTGQPQASPQVSRNRDPYSL